MTPPPLDASPERALILARTHAVVMNRLNEAHAGGDLTAELLLHRVLDKVRAEMRRVADSYHE